MFISKDDIKKKIDLYNRCHVSELNEEAEYAKSISE